MANTTQKAGSLFPSEIIPELITKVRGHSTLAKLSKQSPIPFAGTQEMIFNMTGNASIVGEGEKKAAGSTDITSKIIKPQKFVYQARITDEFKYASEEKKLNYLQAFIDGFAKKIAEAFDIAAIHGLEPKSLSEASFKATNSFDGVVTDNVVTYAEATFDDNLDSAVATIRSNGNDVTGIALSTAGGTALGKIKDKNGQSIYPEFKFGQNPDNFFGMSSDINKTLTIAGDKDHALVGDFENAFKWGYSENIPLEVIEYGDPDGQGRDLKAHNEICLRTEAYIGWGILIPEAFARVKEA